MSALARFPLAGGALMPLRAITDPQGNRISATCGRARPCAWETPDAGELTLEIANGALKILTHRSTF
jgi:nitronate monooxygenase